MFFIGAGVSQSLGLPGSQELVATMGEELGYDAELFGSYGVPSTLAEYYRHEQGTIGDLRSRLDSAWHAGIDIGASAIHRHIVRLQPKLIYTTNWDRWLEKAFEFYNVEFQVVRHVADLRGANSAPVQIVKYHGDFSDDESIVLTESSYFDRMQFETPLDIKLRADSLGRTILFLGYSLEDLNIRFLLYRLFRIWAQSGYASAQPKSFLVTDRPNPVQDVVLREWGVSSIVADGGDTTSERLAGFLSDLRREAFDDTD